MEDERLKRELAADIEGSAPVARRGRPPSREKDRTAEESREISVQERLERFRQTMFTNALPDLPRIPGFHMCWLTTTNPSDPIHRRLQQGYELLRADEVPGMENTSLKTGEYAGYVGINEMIAAKLPEELYQGYMRIAHDEQPREQEESLNRRRDALAEDARRDGGEIYEDEGISELRRFAPSPRAFT